MGPESHCSLLAYIKISYEKSFYSRVICLRDKAKIALLSKLSNFFFDLRLRDRPRERQRSENQTPGATRTVAIPGVA